VSDDGSDWTGDGTDRDDDSDGWNEREEWNEDAPERAADVAPAAGTTAGDASVHEDSTRTPAAGIDAEVAPWETGRGKGGPLRAAGAAIGTVLGAFALALVFVLAGSLVLLLATDGEPGIVGGLMVSLVGSQAAFVVASLAFLRSRGESVRDIGVAVPDVRELALVVLGLGAVFVLVISLGLALQALDLQGASNATADTAQEVPSSLLLLIPIAIFVIGPAEELLFRGVVQRRIREVASAPVAIASASALFAVSHVIALIGDLSAMAVTVFVLFVPALVFGILYEYTKNVVVTALVHGLYDAVIFGLLYVALRYAPDSAQPEGGGAAVLDALALLV